ncbi:MAG TPA: carbamoyltransferase HypF [Mycobacteriales bacterium]|nr:carbamoyltransferase HypF [Mycobacteriales bacterium]
MSRPSYRRNHPEAEVPLEMPHSAEPGATRARAYVSGLVQGVGFRPFVWREATARGLSGWVGNDAAGVVLEVEGAASAVASLLEALTRPPPLARVDEIRSEPLAPAGGAGFAVRTSRTGGARRALVSPDTATCADCARELHDPADRRFQHPFVNCTSCGPRYTIVQAVPYDRSRTTMAPFPFCSACHAEYLDPADRRFHAEPVCCPNCGPQLRLLDRSGTTAATEAIAGTAGLLHAGRVVAVKGLGGYHLAVDARQEAAVAVLRRRKHREDRPFALMVLDVEAAAELCEIGPAELALLTSAARPIVILQRRRSGTVAPSVAPGSPSLGLMLPYTPMHTLLLEAFGGPLVLTSGNVSDEPIAFADADAAERLGGIADAFLVHDRAIRTRVDDSVCKVVGGRVVPIRRSRGYVPTPIPLPQASPESILACGSALKNTFCVTRGQHAFVSHHIGDLDDYATLLSYVDGIAHLTGLLDVAPAVVAHDLHPDYPSTRYALDLPDVQLIAVQHHHAHIASCLADNGVSGPVIGVAFDGVGLGLDGTSWGGEFLLADLSGFTRAAHLAEVAMPGGDAAARQPWRMAAAHLDAAYDGVLPAGLAVAQRQGRRWEQVLSVARAGVNAPRTSSAGRLFDAVSALLGVRDVVTYEAQAAIELEYVADPAETGSYRVPVSDDPVARVQVADLIRALTEDLRRGTPVPVLAGRFHNALADVVADVCRRLRAAHGLGTVALSGGVFQNSLLLCRCLQRLEADRFTVLTHREVPPNDGGISLGQAAVAATLLGASSGQDASAAQVASHRTW